MNATQISATSDRIRHNVDVIRSTEWSDGHPVEEDDLVPGRMAAIGGFSLPDECRGGSTDDVMRLLESWGAS
ncbi:MAG: hypothetical protein AAGA17_00245 [Actinomycetota bacterium]